MVDLSGDSSLAQNLRLIALLAFAVLSTEQAVQALPGRAPALMRSVQIATARSSNKSTAKGKRRNAKDKRRIAKLSTAKKKPYKAINFMWQSQTPEVVACSEAMKKSIRQKFAAGGAGAYSPELLVKAGVFIRCPLIGGIYERREPVRNIIIHSTETGSPADAYRVVASWNRHGLRHPGSQYLVDRDGSILQTVDPRLATVHVDRFKTLYGVNNDNSIGIEVVRACKQKYTEAQLQSLSLLVCYLQKRFDITQIYGHGQVQPSDRSDPVAFNWTGFSRALSRLTLPQTVCKRTTPSAQPKRIS